MQDAAANRKKEPLALANGHHKFATADGMREVTLSARVVLGQLRHTLFLYMFAFNISRYGP